MDTPAPSPAFVSRKVVAFLCCFFAFLFNSASLFSAAAKAGEPATNRFDLPADSADKSLRQFARQSGLQVVFAAEVPAGIKTNSVQGNYVPAEAIKMMLAGTELVATQDQTSGAFMINRGSDPNGQRAAPQTASDRPTQSDASRRPPQDIGDTLKLGEFVVTGSVTPRSKLETPLAITTIDRTKIEEIAPRNTAEIIKTIPGFYMESNAGETLNNTVVRNVALSGAFTYVVLQEDGLPIFSDSTLRHGAADQWTRVTNWIQNVEALRGGSAGVFASNAPLGIINFMSREGTPTLQGEAALQISDYGMVRNELWLSGPMGRDTAFAVGGFYRVDDGLRNPGFRANRGGQIVGNVKHTFVNGRGYIKASGKHLDDRNQFIFPIPLANQASPRGIPGGPDMKTSDNGSPDMRRFIFSSSPAGPLNWDLADGVHSRVSYIGTEIEYQLADRFKLQNRNRYTDGHRSFDAVSPGVTQPWQALANTIANGAGAAGQFAGARDAATSNYRFRLSYPGQNNAIAAPNAAAAAGLINGLGQIKTWFHNSGPLSNFQNDVRLIGSLNEQRTNVTAGLYYATIDNKQFWNYNQLLNDVSPDWRRVDITYLDAAGAAIGPGTFNGIWQLGTQFRNDTSEQREISPFFVVDHKSGSLALDAGYRRHSVRLRGVRELRRGYDVNQPGATIPALRNAQFGTGNFITAKYDLSEYAATAGANYTFNRGFATFVRYAYGPRMPSLTDLMEDMQAGQRLSPTNHIRQYEAGVKYSRRSLGIFLTAFRVELSDVFFANTVILPNGGTSQFTSTTSNDVTGVELESLWTPLPGLSLGLNGTYGDTKYTSDQDFRATTATGQAINVNTKGKVPARTPKLMGTATGAYRFRPTEIGTFSINASWQYTGKRFADLANSSPTPLQAYDDTTVGVSLSTRNGFALRLTVNNVFNDDGLSQGDPRTAAVFLDPNLAFFNAKPIYQRSITGTVSYRF